MIDQHALKTGSFSGGLGTRERVGRESGERRGAQVREAAVFISGEEREAGTGERKRMECRR